MDLIQWPAMVVTVAASWLVASKRDGRRLLGFWLFLLSNLLWIVWGWPAHAFALVALQVMLAGTNLRGLREILSKARLNEAAGSGVRDNRIQNAENS